MTKGHLGHRGDGCAAFMWTHRNYGVNRSLVSVWATDSFTLFNDLLTEI